MSKILVGTASWTDKSLIASARFYPPKCNTPEERLRFYASQFPLVSQVSWRNAITDTRFLAFGTPLV